MKTRDLIPYKAVLEELGVSRTTLWRARSSGIGGFPQPIVRNHMVFWRREDLSKLEDAIFRYRGRVVFERQREAERKVAALTRSARPKRRRRDKKLAEHPDLFGPRG